MSSTRSIAVVDTALEKYRKDFGEPKYVLNICRECIEDLSSQLWYGDSYRGRVVIEVESPCFLCAVEEEKAV